MASRSKSDLWILMLVAGWFLWTGYIACSAAFVDDMTYREYRIRSIGGEEFWEITKDQSHKRPRNWAVNLNYGITNLLVGSLLALRLLQRIASAIGLNRSEGHRSSLELANRMARESEKQKKRERRWQALMKIEALRSLHDDLKQDETVQQYWEAFERRVLRPGKSTLSQFHPITLTALALALIGWWVTGPLAGLLYGDCFYYVVC